MTTETKDTVESVDSELLDDLDLDSALEDTADLDLDLGAMMDADPESDGDPDGARVYDFNRPHSVSRRFEKNLQNIAEQFARLATVNLTSLLRSNVVIEFQGVHLSSYAEMREKMPRPACLAAMTIRPLNGQSLLQMDMSLCFVIMKKLMGGRVDAEDRIRAFTEIERGVVNQFIGRLTEMLRTAATKLIDLEPEVVALENNPDYISSIAGGETLASLRFRLRLESVEGGLEFAFPLTAFTPVKHIVDPEDNIEVRSSDEINQDRTQILDMIQATSSELVVQMGELDLTLDRVLALKEGEVLNLPTAVDSPLTVLVEGREVFLAEAGRINQNRAVKLVQKLEEE